MALTADLTNLVYEFLDTNGDGSGEINAIGDYSGAGIGAKRFCHKHDTRGFSLARINIFVEDSGSFDSGGYGNGAALENGVRATIRNEADDIVKDLTGRVPIRTNAEWSITGARVDEYSFGSGNNYIDVNALVTFPRPEDGQMIGIPIPPRYSFNIELSDDFTHLVAQYFKIFGWYTQ